MADQALAVLQKTFGLHDFRGLQREIIDHVIAGGDALVLMPTGGGKSLCYQIPALVREGMGVVVSPLIALMQDQVAALQEVGVRALFINSTLEAAQVEAARQEVLAGRVDILYIAPERLLMPQTLDLLRRVPVSLFAIDEAHCVSMWGHNFRPEYGQLSCLREYWPQVPRMALTATADLHTREEICEKLLLNPRRFIASFDRPNIRYTIVNKSRDPKGQLRHFIEREHAGDAGIVYCIKRADTEEMAQYLSSFGIKALPYHAGMSAEERQHNQEVFLKEEGIVVCATIAFGMGIDKPDVRFVAHANMPSTIEGYFQETGRAGRDGEPADAWMAYGLKDVMDQIWFLDQSGGDPVYVRRRRAKLDSMLALCETAGCRRQMLLQYFGEESEPCGNCDNCLNPPHVVDRTVEAQKLISCLFRMQQKSGFTFGAGQLFDVLLGHKNERVLRFGHDTLSTFGIGTELKEEDWRRLLRQLICRQMVVIDSEHYNTLTLGHVKGVLKGEEKVFLTDTAAPKVRGRKTSTAVASLTTEERTLFEKLRAWRRERAQSEDKPPYRICSDATLADIVRKRPAGWQGLLEVSGLGEKRVETYGADILQVLARSA